MHILCGVRTAVMDECEVFYRPQRVKYSRLCTQEYIMVRIMVLVKTNGQRDNIGTERCGPDPPPSR
jgi:hypothetical protein